MYFWNTLRMNDKLTSVRNTSHIGKKPTPEMEGFTLTPNTLNTLIFIDSSQKCVY